MSNWGIVVFCWRSVLRKLFQDKGVVSARELVEDWGRATVCLAGVVYWPENVEIRSVLGAKPELAFVVAVLQRE